MKDTVEKDYKEATETLGEDKGGRVQKQFVYNRIDNFTSEGDALHLNLATALADTSKAQAQDTKYLARLQVSATKFDSMYDAYLNQLPQGKTDGVKKAFEGMMDAIQHKNGLITLYNNCQAKRLQLTNDMAATDIMINRQKDTAGNMSNMDLQLAGAFLSKAHFDIGKSTFETVYCVARNFNCVALRSTTVFRCLNPLQSFTGINSTILETAVNTYLLGNDIAKYQKENIPFEDKHKIITVTVDENLCPGMFRQVKKTAFDKNGKKKETTVPQMTFRLAADDDTLGFNKKWWNIRLTGYETLLPGATQKRPANADAKKTYNEIQFDVRTPGLMSYKPSEEAVTVQEFQLPPVYSPCSYTYQPGKAGKEPFTTTATPTKPVHMEFKLREKDVAMPMQSPFATWIIEPYDDVDLTKCTSVEMKFSVAYRATKS